MAPLPEIEDTYRIALRWNYDNIVNVIHVHAAAMNAAIMGDLIASHVTKEMWGSNTTSVSITQLDITPLFADTATYNYVTDGSTKWAGKLAGDSVPNTASVVSLKTSLRGPSNRGRIFIGPIAESCLNTGIINTAQRNELVSAWTAFGGALIADDAQHVVASYKNSTAITVLQYSVRAAAGTMRRRQSRLAA